MSRATPKDGKQQLRGFDIGVIYAAWWLESAHGEDTYAADMLREAVGRHGVGRIQRLAQREGYHFRRGFWARVRRK